MGGRPFLWSGWAGLVFLQRGGRGGGRCRRLAEKDNGRGLKAIGGKGDGMGGGTPFAPLAQVLCAAQQGKVHKMKRGKKRFRGGLFLLHHVVFRANHCGTIRSSLPRIERTGGGGGSGIGYFRRISDITNSHL